MMNMKTETPNTHDSQLEAAILGACLIETAAMPLVADKLRPEMFYEENYLEIYSALQSMYRDGKSIDIITVKNELAARGTLEAVGGPYELTRLSSAVVSSAHLEYHVLILRQLHLRRSMRLGFQQLLGMTADESLDIDDILVEAHRLLEHLESDGSTADHLRSMPRLMTDTLVQVDARVESGSADGITGIPTGLAELDRLTAGWLLAATRDVDPQHLKDGRLTPDELAQLREASAELSRLPIHVDDHAVTSMDRVRSVARVLQSKGRCDMLILDYLQLCNMKSDQKNRNREQEVAQASRKAKLLAKELNIPVLLLSQLNRESDSGYSTDHRPSLHQLRESGALEQDADMVMLLYRPAMHGKATDKKSTYPTEGLGVVIVAKNRNGNTGEVYFHHNPSMTKLADYVPPMEWMMRNSR